MITKCTMIVMLLFSASAMPIHTEPVRHSPESLLQEPSIKIETIKRSHIIKEGKTYEECMNESFNNLYEGINTQFKNLKKPELVEPKIEI